MERVNILGAGLAGLSAAIALAEKNIGCRLISRQVSERAQSVLAEGGINAALDTMGEGDSTELHFEETYAAGVELADPAAVRLLAERAPAVIEKLIRLGVPFCRGEEKLILRNFGGQKKKRTAYVKSSTGKAVMTALIDEARKYEAAGLIERYAHHDFLSLGTRVLDTYTQEVLEFPGPVILACGGLGGLFPGQTTGTADNSADAAAALFAQGLAFSNLEMIQYHPTTFPISGKRCLISEAARGEGGRLFTLRDGKPRYFMEEKYPELGNLMPRDVVSREIDAILRDGLGNAQVFLDMTDLSPATWEAKLPELREEILRYLHIDPATEPVPVEPGIHYFMGGIHVDAAHRTNLPGVYAAGECCSQYHGANRLGGNSMLGAIIGGEIAAESAVRSDETVDAGCNGDVDFASRKGMQSLRPHCTQHPHCTRLGDILRHGLGIRRSEAGILAALDELTELERENDDAYTARKITLAKAMLFSANLRRESRGAHFREDYPERAPGMERPILASCEEGDIQVRFAEGSGDAAGI